MKLGCSDLEFRSYTKLRDVFSYALFVVGLRSIRPAVDVNNDIETRRIDPSLVLVIDNAFYGDERVDLST